MSSYNLLIKTVNAKFKPITGASYQIVIQSLSVSNRVRERIILNDIFKCSSKTKYTDNLERSLNIFHLYSHFSNKSITAHCNKYNDIVDFRTIDDLGSLRISNIAYEKTDGLEFTNGYKVEHIPDHIFYYHKISLIMPMMSLTKC